METLEALGNIGEFAGSLLVALTLIYIAIQTRQTSKSLQMLKAEKAVDVISRFNEKLLESEEIVELWLKGTRSTEPMNQVEELRFRALWVLWIHFPITVWESGERDMNRYIAFARLLSYEGARRYFDQSIFPDGLREHILLVYEKHCLEDA